MYCIGAKIPETAQFAAEIASLHKALESINIANQMNHHGGEIGSYDFQRGPDNSMLCTCANPYPCEFDRGIIEGLARKFCPAGQRLTVRHDHAAPCRAQGADSCTYLIELTK